MPKLNLDLRLTVNRAFTRSEAREIAQHISRLLATHHLFDRFFGKGELLHVTSRKVLLQPVAASVSKKKIVTARGYAAKVSYVQTRPRYATDSTGISWSTDTMDAHLFSTQAMARMVAWQHAKASRGEGEAVTAQRRSTIR